MIAISELAAELKQILAFVFERAHAGLSAQQRAAARIDTLAPYNMVHVSD